MFRLTREVRFGISADGSAVTGAVHNGYAGYPPLVGVGHYFRLRVTVAGDLEAKSSYLLNIKEIDEVVRSMVVPITELAVRRRSFGQGAGVVQKSPAWIGSTSTSSPCSPVIRR